MGFNSGFKGLNKNTESQYFSTTESDLTFLNSTSYHQISKCNSSSVYIPPSVYDITFLWAINRSVGTRAVRSDRLHSLSFRDYGKRHLKVKRQ